LFFEASVGASELFFVVQLQSAQILQATYLRSLILGLRDLLSSAWIFGGVKNEGAGLVEGEGEGEGEGFRTGATKLHFMVRLHEAQLLQSLCLRYNILRLRNPPKSGHNVE
jgi:hypothetical protein